MAAAPRLLLVSLLSFVACSKSAPPPGQAVSFAELCNGADGSRVRLSGFFRYPRGMLSFCSNFGGHETCDMELYEAAAAPPDYDVMRAAKEPGAVTAKLSVPVGAQPGEMDDLPKKFAASDVKLHLPGGALGAEGAHVVVDGKLSVVPGDPKTPSAPKSCFVNVEWVTSAP